MRSAISDIRKVTAATNTAPYRMIGVSWEDASRTEGSCWGDNITDVRRFLLERRGGDVQEHQLPCLRRNNFEHTKGDLIRVRAGALALVTGNHPTDGKAGVLRPTTLASYLSSLRTNASGVVTQGPKGVLLPRAGDDEVLVRIQAVILPLHCGDNVHDVRGMRDGEAEFVDKVYNYNTYSAGTPRNLLLHCTPQGTAVATSKVGMVAVYQQVNSDGVMRDATTLVAASSHAAGEVGQEETEDERKSAEAKGYGTAMHIGVKQMGKAFNVAMSVQVPLEMPSKSRRQNCGFAWDSDSNGFEFCAASQCAYDSTTSVSRRKCRSARSAPQRKTLREKSNQDESKDAGAKETLNTSCGRVSYGTIGKPTEKITATLKRDVDESLTATITLMYTVRDPSAFTGADVQQIVANLNAVAEMLQAPGNAPAPEGNGAAEPHVLTSWAEVGKHKAPVFITDNDAGFPEDNLPQDVGLILPAEV